MPRVGHAEQAEAAPPIRKSGKVEREVSCPYLLLDRLHSIR